MHPEQILDVGDRAGSKHRHLHILRKLGPTPADLPRRPGHGQEAPQGLTSCSSGLESSVP